MALPSFLRPEVLDYASIEIVSVPAPVCPYCPTFDKSVNRQGATSVMCAACRDAFAVMLAHPSTSARLDAMLADNARIDAQLREDDRLDDMRNSQDEHGCTSQCGYCGRCS